jgi:CubicO group peptidase (beta-lactamase class C family)
MPTLTSRTSFLSSSVCAWLALVFGAGSLAADPIDDYVTAQIKRQNIPGLSLAVVKDGKVIKAKGYGLANLEWKIAATPETAYQLASVSKQFTATGIMLLVEEGKVQLSDPIRKYFSELPVAWSNITVRHLLTMTSGIKDYLNIVPPDEWRKDFTHERIVQIMTEAPLDFAAGEKFSYSNSNYVLLAMLIQKLSGKSYDAFLAERVWGPLQMTATRRDNPFDVIPNRAALYDWKTNHFENIDFLSPSLWNNGDGGLLSSAADLARWDAALYTERVLKKTSLQQMWAPTRLNDGQESQYGFGWSLARVRGHRLIGHGGGRPGTATQISRFIDEGVTVIVLINGRGDPSGISRRVAGYYIPGLTLDTLKPEEDPSPEFSRQLKQFLVELAEKKDSEMLTPEFRKNFGTSKGRYAALQKDMKELKSFTFIVNDEAGKLQRLGVPIARLSSYRMETSDGPHFYTFSLTADQKVGWIEVTE